jgi:hypothetical protein
MRRAQPLIALLLLTRAGDGDRSDELRAFVEDDVESKIRSGMTSEEARRAAFIELSRRAASAVAGLSGIRIASSPSGDW